MGWAFMNQQDLRAHRFQQNQNSPRCINIEMIEGLLHRIELPAAVLRELNP